MKTAEDKARELLAKWAKRVIGYDSDSDDEAHAISDIVLLLKEQDRDTRHACADAIIVLAKYGDDKDYIKTDDATAACLNHQFINSRIEEKARCNLTTT